MCRRDTCCQPEVWRRVAAEGGFALDVRAESVSLYCGMHRTCASDERVLALLPPEELQAVQEFAGLLDGFAALEQKHLEMDRLAAAFEALDLETDVFLCAFPTIWCRLHERSSKPVVGYLDQPLFLFVPLAINSVIGMLCLATC